MLNQAAGDRQILADQLNISPHQLSYVTHSGEGEGLLFYGNVILPFVDRFPTDLELYRIMTTKLTEVQEAKGGVSDGWQKKSNLGDKLRQEREGAENTLRDSRNKSRR